MNKVFIATSLDGYISDAEGKIDWLHQIPNPEQNDMGYGEFMSGIDAIVMGRTTYETVLGFDMEWPYQVPVFVLSNSLDSIPDELIGKIEILSGEVKEITEIIQEKGFNQLYIDGGKVIQQFLQSELIDEITITTIPFLLGGGTRLFDTGIPFQKFKCASTKLYLEQVVQSRFVR